MKTLAIRGILAVTVLTVFAVAAAPAQATITPVNARISATSTDSQFDFQDRSITGLRCPLVEFTGTINATGTAISGTLAFLPTTLVRCRGRVGASDQNIDPIICRITLRSVSSVASTNVSFDLAFDAATAGAPCSITFPGAGPLTLNVDAQTIRNCITFNQPTQSLTLDCRGVIVTSTAARASRPMDFRGNFSINTVNGARRNLTIS